MGRIGSSDEKYYPTPGRKKIIFPINKWHHRSQNQFQWVNSKYAELSRKTRPKVISGSRGPRRCSTQESVLGRIKKNQLKKGRVQERDVGIWGSSSVGIICAEQAWRPQSIPRYHAENRNVVAGVDRQFPMDFQGLRVWSGKFQANETVPQMTIWKAPEEPHPRLTSGLHTYIHMCTYQHTHILLTQTRMHMYILLQTHWSITHEDWEFYKENACVLRRGWIHMTKEEEGGEVDEPSRDELLKERLDKCAS